MPPLNDMGDPPAPIDPHCPPHPSLPLSASPSPAEAQGRAGARLVGGTPPALADPTRPPQETSAYGLPYSLRVAAPQDAAEIEDLLRKAYGRLLVPDYGGAELAAALPGLSAAYPAFLASPTCFIAEGPCGRILGCGGWSEFSPFRARSFAGLGHVHHIVTDPDHIGSGIGAAIFGQVELSARLAGITRLHALVTRTAAGFFRAQGMQAMGEVAMRITPEIRLPAEEMHMDLAGV